MNEKTLRLFRAAFLTAFQAEGSSFLIGSRTSGLWELFREGLLYQIGADPESVHWRRLFSNLKGPLQDPLRFTQEECSFHDGGGRAYDLQDWQSFRGEMKGSPARVRVVLLPDLTNLSVIAAVTGFPHKTVWRMGPVAAFQTLAYDLNRMAREADAGRYIFLSQAEPSEFRKSLARSISSGLKPFPVD